ncbi:MAG: HlyD family efflux transporter periplasmic adaptor subunit [Clostridia bacterium]
MRGARTNSEKKRATTGRGRRRPDNAGSRRSHLTFVGGAPRLAAASGTAASAGEDGSRRRRVRSLMAGGAVFTLAVISLTVWSLHKATTISAFERRLECAQAVWGSVEEGLEVDGIVVRDEKVFVSPIAGKVRLVVREGERVRTGAVVAEVARDEARQRLEPPLVSARDELAKFDAYARARLEELKRQLASHKLEVENEKWALDRARVSRDVQEEKRHKEALARANTEVAAATGRLEEEEKALQARGLALAAKVRACEAAYKQAVHALRAEAPGVVSFELDGLEHVLTPVSARDLAPDRVRSLSESPVRVSDGAEVAEGEPVFRLVDNYRLLMLVLLSGEDAAAITSSRVRVKFASPQAGGGLLPVRVVSQGDPAPSGERVVFLEVSGFPQELCRVRRTHAKLVTRVAYGLTIPRRAVVKDGEECFVYAPVNLGVMKRPVEIVAGDQDTVIVRGLKEGQRVLTNPTIVQEARITVWR